MTTDPTARLATRLRETLAAVGAIEALTNHVQEDEDALAASHASLRQSLTAWAVTGTTTQRLLQSLTARNDDAELCVRWEVVSRRTGLVAAVEAGLVGVDWSTLGASLRVSQAATLLPTHSSDGVTHAALINLVLCRVGVQATLLGATHQLQIDVLMTLYEAREHELEARRVGAVHVRGEDAFWRLSFAPAFVQMLARESARVFDREAQRLRLTLRSALPLPELRCGITWFQRNELVVTVLSVIPDAFLRISSRIWLKLLGEKVGGNDWQLIGPDDRRAHPGPRTSAHDNNPRLQAIEPGADAQLKLTSARVLEDQWEYVSNRAKAAYRGSRDEYVQWRRPWYEIAVDPSDRKAKLAWNFEYVHLHQRCVRGGWRWYNWELRYVCEQWEPGSFQAPFSVYGAFAANGRDLTFLISAVGTTFLEYDTRVNAGRIEASSGSPFSMVVLYDVQ